ncbi:MAG: metallophosphoesterase [Sphingomonas bacterium]|nr:metallophosphoesterase [Sphingomonas bacterium]
MNQKKSFWQKAPATWQEPPAIPHGHRIYAVGDVHGQDHLLADLLAQIETDIVAIPGREVTIVFLGDLIDRGSKSAQVVERLRTYRPLGIRTEFLTGNHEEVLLRILEGEIGLLADWLRFGGAHCARSYGLSATGLAKMSPADAIETLRSAIPPEHQSFLASFGDTFRAGDYLFVHAGIRPGIALAEQAQIDLRWIRDPFLDHPARHDVMVVHGHTITEEVDVRAGRIGIDTGAYKFGVLTALVLERDQRRVIQSRTMPVGQQPLRP